MERLKRLLEGPRTEEAAAEARRLVAAYRQEDAPTAAAKSRRKAGPTERELEDVRWRRAIARRRGGMGSAVVWNPARDSQRRAVRGQESASVRENEQATYLRRFSHWR